MTIPPVTNKINALMKAVVQSEVDINILLRLTHNKRTFDMIKKIYRVFLKSDVVTARDLVAGGISYASAYRLLILMTEQGLITPHTLRNIEGSDKPAVAWRLT